MDDQHWIFWFRRDLRLDDNHALYQALKSGNGVKPIFIFDKHILEKLDNNTDARVTFIFNELFKIKEKLNKMGSDLELYHDFPENIHKKLATKSNCIGLMFNHDYEPYAIERDSNIKQIWETNGKLVHSFKDQCLFDKEEILKDDGKPYTVFTPYSKKWKNKLKEMGIPHFPSQDLLCNLYAFSAENKITLKELGFQESNKEFPQRVLPEDIVRDYATNRDFPGINGTSKLSVHFRFGTVSIRKAINHAQHQSEKFLNELIWREFYMSILYHFPHVTEKAFKKDYDFIPWRNNEAEFEQWTQGKTGYPLVDAGMRELLATGYMHNRVRMVVASFLTKHLLIDWRWGEAWFARHLLDFELASNNGGWQWASGSGVDAAPYFRVFNPELQALKFDPNNTYIKKWVPEFGTSTYPKPIVDHTFARQRCLEAYRIALGATLGA